MIQSKRINIIIMIAVVFALIISMLLVTLGNLQSSHGGIKSEPQYASRVFGTDIISIEIIADEADWQKMLDNAIKEEFIVADVIVNGTKFKNVGIRPKGNSSLTQVSQSDSDRYSFRFQFDEYIKDQTCFGLTSFVVNNMLGDNTYMKEYVSYEMMTEIGVEAPYCGFADIKVNGESWGLYLAVELYNDSYEQRVFGDTSGMLYNVKRMDMGGGNNAEGGNPHTSTDNQAASPQNRSGQTGENTSDSEQTDANSQTALPLNNTDNAIERSHPGGDMGGGGMGGPGGSSGGSLEYSDDSTSSYSSIFNNVVGKGTENDYQRVIEAIKSLNEGTDLETYFDVDQILRYLAAHTIVVNLDSYSSSMAQNYYIYEKDGKITILPWDYNLSWGGFQSRDASSVINFPIDTPVSGIEMSARPLIEKLFENTDYLDRYHSYLQELISTYFADGKFEAKINELDAMISEYVKNDATAFCTFEEYKTAISAFITLGNLRAESVQGQLDGAIPATADEQKSNASALIDSSSVNLSDLGTMGMGGGPGGQRGNFAGGQGGNFPGGQGGNNSPGGSNQPGVDMPKTGSMPNSQQGNGMRFSSNTLPDQINWDYVLLVGALVLVLVGAAIIAAKLKRNY